MEFFQSDYGDSRGYDDSSRFPCLRDRTRKESRYGLMTKSHACFDGEKKEFDREEAIATYRRELRVRTIFSPSFRETSRLKFDLINGVGPPCVSYSRGG